MEFFRTWIVPPLVGAIIGYFTNWLAIKMLFRPLEPIYVGRFKLPFTPGILPAERARLSESVGETVSTELLSAEVFRSRLADENLRSKVEEAIVSILKTILEKPVSPALRDLGRDGARENGAEAVPADPAALLSASLAHLLASPEFRDSLAVASRKAAEEFSQARLGEVLSPDKFRQVVADYARRLGEKEGQDRAEGLADKLAELLGSSADPLFSAKALAPLVELTATSLYTAVLPVVERLLESPEISAELQASAMSVVRGAIGRLKPVQRLIVGVASYEKTFEETMPDTVADLTRSAVALLRKPETSARVLSSTLDYLKANREGTTGKGLGIFPSEAFKPALRTFLAETAAEGGDFSERLGRRYEALAERRIGDLAPGLPAAIAGRTADFLVPSPLGRAALGRGVSAFLAAYADNLEGRSIGQVLGLEGDATKRIAAALARGVTKALASQAEKLIEALDIQSMVVDKLNSLKMLEVEQLILKVVNEELNWITILGGILGAVIGIFQSLISLL
ncbi:MAG: DUF445 family protein [Spirochaetes bacterium]|nr:DUF445 family protein [Spirochaetota bacterium]